MAVRRFAGGFLPLRSSLCVVVVLVDAHGDHVVESLITVHGMDARQPRRKCRPHLLDQYQQLLSAQPGMTSIGAHLAERGTKTRIRVGTAVGEVQSRLLKDAPE